jgi:hypothetical protein
MDRADIRVLSRRRVGVGEGVVRVERGRCERSALIANPMRAVVRLRARQSRIVAQDQMPLPRGVCCGRLDRSGGTAPYLRRSAARLLRSGRQPRLCRPRQNSAPVTTALARPTARASRASARIGLSNRPREGSNIRFARDSLLEGGGFEPSVPLVSRRRSEQGVRKAWGPRWRRPAASYVVAVPSDCGQPIVRPVPTGPSTAGLPPSSASPRTRESLTGDPVRAGLGTSFYMLDTPRALNRSLG